MCNAVWCPEPKALTFIPFCTNNSAILSKPNYKNLSSITINYQGNYYKLPSATAVCKAVPSYWTVKLIFDPYLISFSTVSSLFASKFNWIQNKNLNHD